MALFVSNVGTTRRVFVARPVALKVARHAHGKRCNLFEKRCYDTASERRRSMLCPVIWCSPRGTLLIARAAEPLTEAEAAELRRAEGFPDWDYGGLGDLGCPFEHKAPDWGRLGGRLVALDYDGDGAID